MSERMCVVCGSVIPRPASGDVFVVANYERQVYCGSGCRREGYNEKRRQRRRLAAGVRADPPLRKPPETRREPPAARVRVKPAPAPVEASEAREALLEALRGAFEMHPDFRVIMLNEASTLGKFEMPSRGYFARMVNPSPD